MPGQALFSAFCAAARKSARIGDAGEAIESSPETAVTFKPGVAAIFSSAARISSRLWPGKIRQLTLAVARWGKAFCAWPPEIIVGTQVVPTLPT